LETSPDVPAEHVNKPSDNTSVTGAQGVNPALEGATDLNPAVGSTSEAVVATQTLAASESSIGESEQWQQLSVLHLRMTITGPLEHATEWPAWVSAAVEYFKTVSSSSRWLKLVEKWVSFEAHLSFPSTVSSLCCSMIDV
jgi:hypothetical protein